MSEHQGNCVIPTMKQRNEIIEQLMDVPTDVINDKLRIHEQSVRANKRGETSKQQQEEIDCKRRRTEMAADEDLELRLYAWFSELRASGDRVTDLMLRAKALSLSNNYGATSSSFDGSYEWMKNFKKRYIYGGSDGTDNFNKTVESFIRELRRRVKEEDLQLNHIYNMDEMNLIWKAIPDKTLASMDEVVVYGPKPRKEQLTVGLCCNALGTHKLRPLLVYKYERPKALRRVKIEELPVVYKSQRNACVDATVFENWLENHFKPAVKKHQQNSGTRGKILLLIDNFKPHCIVQGTIEKLKYDDIDVMFLPKGCTMTLQPMVQGITTKLKRSYREKSTTKILHHPGGIEKFFYDFDITDCINQLHEAWSTISSTDIRNSWTKLLAKIMVEKSNGEIAETVQTKDLQMREAKEEENPGNVPMPLEERMQQVFADLIQWSSNKHRDIKLHVLALTNYYNLSLQEKRY